MRSEESSSLWSGVATCVVIVGLFVVLSSVMLWILSCWIGLYVWLFSFRALVLWLVSMLRCCLPFVPYGAKVLKFF